MLTFFIKKFLSREINPDNLVCNNLKTSDDLVKEFKKHSATPDEIIEDAKIIAKYLLQKKDFTALDKGRLLRIANSKDWNVDCEIAEN